MMNDYDDDGNDDINYIENTYQLIIFLCFIRI